MKILYSILLIILIIGCSSTESNTEGTNISEVVQIDSTIESPNITGRWRYIRNEVIVDAEIKEVSQNIFAEWTYFYTPYRADIVIEKDSLYRVDYPMELDSRMKYDINSGFIKTGGNIGLSRYKLKDDTLIFYRTDEDNFVKELFKKVEYSDSIMSILKNDTINYPLLAGKWHLLRDYNINNDGTLYTLDFPYTIPDEIKLSKQHILKTMHDGRKINFLTDGINRTYTYNYVNYWLTLTPGDWYKGDDVILEFERYIE
jgi:hypothetical protein